MGGVYALIVLKCTYATLAYPSNAILLTNSAPTTLSLGTINGVAASTASLARACGPTISGLLYTMGLESGYSGLAWWVTGLVTIAGAYISFSITEPRGRLDLMGRPRFPWLGEASRSSESLPTRLVMLDRLLEVSVVR